MSTQPVVPYSRAAAAHLHMLPPHEQGSPLIERDVELQALHGAVARLAGGEGGVVTIEAAAGLGKTALLEEAECIAADAGCLVRHAAPGPLERHFPFGVVRALLDQPLRDAPDEERARLLDGAAAQAGALLLEGTVPGGDCTTTLAHSLLWLCAAIADARPLALIVDDAQWADRSSLEVLSYLARRVADVPLLIVVAARAGDPEAPADLLSMLSDAPASTLLHPAPLSVEGAVELIQRFVPLAPIEVCRACHRASGGNPWVLYGLADQIEAHGPASVEVTDRDPPPITAAARAVVGRRLGTLAGRDRAVATALAVIGGGASPHVLAAVAGVPVAELGAARDALVAAGLLRPSEDQFAHELIALAAAEGLAGTERERLHRQAAGALRADGASDDAVAGHLLQCGPDADPDVSALLVRAASAAAGRGAPHTAAAYLERALAERAVGDDRGRLLARLGTMAFDA